MLGTLTLSKRLYLIDSDQDERKKSQEKVEPRRGLFRPATMLSIRQIKQYDISFLLTKIDLSDLDRFLQLVGIESNIEEAQRLKGVKLTYNYDSLIGVYGRAAVTYPKLNTLDFSGVSTVKLPVTRRNCSFAN